MKALMGERKPKFLFTVGKADNHWTNPLILQVDIFVNTYFTSKYLFISVDQKRLFRWNGRHQCHK